MVKEKRLTDFKLPYVVLISKFIKYFGVDMKYELEDLIGTLNHVSCLNLHKMRFSKVNNFRTTRGDQAVVEKNDGEVYLSGINQEDEEKNLVEPMEIVPYYPPEDNGPSYSPFQRIVLNKLCEFNVAQDKHHNFYVVRFQDLDE